MPRRVVVTGQRMLWWFALAPPTWAPNVQNFQHGCCCQIMHPVCGPAFAFTALTPLSVVSAKQGNFIKSQYEMLECDHIVQKKGLECDGM